MTSPVPQAESRLPVLLPAAVDAAFTYASPEALPPGTLVEAPLMGRKLVGTVWDGMADDVPAKKLKPIGRVLSHVTPLSAAYRQWIDWIADFTLAPRGAVLSLAALSLAGKATRKPFVPPQYNIALPELTPAQQTAADAMRHELRRGQEGERAISPRSGAPVGAQQPEQGAMPILLDGVTGSGKTEVYFHAIADAIGNGGQVLILLPEIALTHQWFQRFEKTFGAAATVWHSQQTPAARTRAWHGVSSGAAQVVVGARSALFLPFKNLSLIVVDEEHDPSYKQDDGVLYHARDMAVMRARFEQIPILLVSATPSLETLYNVQEGRYRALHLPERFGAAGLPAVSLIDMVQTPPERGDFLSPPIKSEMLATLARGEQTLLFLNRRGYAPLLLCRACGHRFQCSDCSAWLVVHGKKFELEHRVAEGEPRSDGVSSEGAKGGFSPPSRAKARTFLVCHHCDHREPIPSECPACKAEPEKFAACGPGVERIAEGVRAMFPNAVIASDQRERGNPVVPDSKDADWIAASPPAPRNDEEKKPTIAILSSDESVDAETWDQIEKGEIDILIGTQMAAKGHHFPRLSFVGVVDADVGLSGADLRAGERTYQLLHQLGGRAGRGEIPGRVFIQTYQPAHPIMQALVRHDRDGVIAIETRMREAGHWPPFGQLAAILLDGVNEAAVKAAGQQLARSAPADDRLRILGPAPAPLSKLRGQYRYRLLVKAKKGIHLQRTLKRWLDGQKFSGVRVKIDVNPYYFQ